VHIRYPNEVWSKLRMSTATLFFDEKMIKDMSDEHEYARGEE
jgi:hypothetical protein